MRVIRLGALQEYWSRPGRRNAEQPLKAWYAEVRRAAWKSPNDLKRAYRSASVLADNRVVFNICGNSHRLVVHLNYELGIVLVKFIGTHAEYDEIDASSVGRKEKKK